MAKEITFNDSLLPLEHPSEDSFMQHVGKFSQSNCFIFDIFSTFKLIIAARSCYNLSAGVALFFSIVKQDPEQGYKRKFYCEAEPKIGCRSRCSYLVGARHNKN